MLKRNLVLALALVGLMFTAVERAQAEPLVALQAFTSTDFLLRFDSATPDTVERIGVSGLGSGGRLVGIDYRPANGLLYGLANRFNPPTQENITSIYTIDPSTGVATVVSSLSTPLSDRSVIPRVGIDFDPVSDRLRVVNALNHQNLRINVDTGETVVDGSINPNSRQIAASAYMNNFAGATSTTLYGIDTSRPGGFLVIQDPNSGTLTDVGSLGLSFPSSATIDAGFDISGLTGIAYYTAYTGSVAGGGSLWRVNLATGRLSYLGLIGGEGTFQFLGLAAQVRTPVPEPATMILLGTGLAGIAVKARRRRKDNQD